MPKFSIDKYFEILFEIDPETNDFLLEPDEYIRLVAIKEKVVDSDTGEPSKKIPIVINKYYKTKSNIIEFVKKYMYNYNIYIGLSTTKGENATSEYMYRRKTLMLDFDKKDYKQYSDVKDFSRHIKARLPELFNHMIVDSGNGYHFYVATKLYKNINRVANVNRELAEIVGADTKATLPTQIVRLPTSYNNKDPSNPKYVTIVANNLESNPQKFSPYGLAKIEKMIEISNNNKIFWEQVQPLPSIEYTNESRFYCVENMLSRGVQQGERNFALGRITKYLQLIKGYTKYHALETVQEWNRKCDPPKPPNIVEMDFNNYWDKDYKLLGCFVTDESDQKIINRFCDKTLCRTIEEHKPNIEGTELMFDNNLLKNTIMRKLSGYHYMVLSVLDFHNRGLTKKELIEKLTGRQTKKCCISEK